MKPTGEQSKFNLWSQGWKMQYSLQRIEKNRPLATLTFLNVNFNERKWDLHVFLVCDLKASCPNRQSRYLWQAKTGSHRQMPMTQIRSWACIRKYKQTNKQTNTRADPTVRNHWTTHHHVIGFGDVYFKLKPSAVVVTLIWRKKDKRSTAFNHRYTLHSGFLHMLTDGFPGLFHDF